MAPALRLAFALLFFPTLILSEPLHVTLTHRRHPKLIRDWADEANKLRRRYGYPIATSQSRRSNSRAVGGIPMFVQGRHTSYAATLTIGTPPQPFQVVLGTGSSDLWLPGQNCPTCTPGSPIFDTSTSSTFKGTDEKVNISYGSGEVSGTLGSDNVSMGGFTVPSQTFLSVDAMAMTTVVYPPVSGFMGLGFQSIASTGATPFWQALIGNNELTSPEMSFWLARDLNPINWTTLAPGGVFTLGGTNSSLFSGDIEFINLSSTPSYWQLSLSSLTVNGAAVPLSNANSLCAFDTGTTLIGGPHDDVVSFYRSIPGSVNLDDDPAFFAFPCSTTNVTVSMSFGGKSWPINFLDLNLGPVYRRNSSLCFGAIFDLSHGTNVSSIIPAWVVGYAFLKNVYTVLRSSPASVGFAQLSSAAGGSNAAGPKSTSTPAGFSTIGTVSSLPPSPPTGIPFFNAAMLTAFSSFLMLSTVTAVIMLCL